MAKTLYCTDDLLGHYVTIMKSDFSEAKGKVVKVSVQKIGMDLGKGINGVETNVWLTIQDEQGVEHTGTLVID